MADHNVPDGAWAQLNFDLIDEGQLRRDVERALQRTFRDLRQFELDHGSNGKARLTIDVEIAGLQAGGNTYEIATSVKTKLPTPKRTSAAVVRGSRLVCQPTGSNEDATQMVLLDNQGRPFRGVDPETGQDYGDEASDTPVGKLGS